MKKKVLACSILLLTLFLFSTKDVYAYRRATTDEYKEFLREFLESKYYINTDTEDSDGICNVGTVQSECSSVKVSSTGGSYDLDTYVAGVLSAEPGATIDGNDELGKAWAIIIRSFTVAHTNDCKNSITASSNEQNFNSSDMQTYKKYAEETSGIVMTKDNKIIEAVYSLARASDCISVEGNRCKFKRCADFSESPNSCPGESTEFIVPQGTITYTNSDIHYGGIEPYIARYLANSENYKYDQILKAFYGENIALAKLSSSNSSSDTITTSCNNSSGSVSKTGKAAIDKMTEIALKQAEEVHSGGQKFWSWYGFPSRDEWCAMFVSWLFNQVGGLNKYIKGSAVAGAIPRESVAAGYGTWYEDECTDPKTVPQAGDVIVFDPHYNGTYTPYPQNQQDKYYSSHVGYVYKVDDTYVYTVEGNSGDRVRAKQYSRKTHCQTVGIQGINGYFRPNY